MSSYEGLNINLKHKTCYYKINIQSFNIDLAVKAYIKRDTHDGSEKQLNKMFIQK